MSFVLTTESNRDQLNLCYSFVKFTSIFHFLSKRFTFFFHVYNLVNVNKKMMDKNEIVMFDEIRNIEKNKLF